MLRAGFEKEAAYIFRNWDGRPTVDSEYDFLLNSPGKQYEVSRSFLGLYPEEYELCMRSFRIIFKALITKVP